MEAVLSVILVCVSVCLVSVQSKAEYDTYSMDSKLCAHSRKSGLIHIWPWKAAVLTFGNPPGSDLPPPGRDIHNCKVTITTQENFSLGAVIEDMSIGATLNKATRAWECDGDYLKISTVGTSLISKVLDLIPGDFFRSKKTEKLCGVRRGKPRFSEVGSNADVFSTIAKSMEVMFNQAESKTSPVNNSFRIVITTFKYVKEVAFSEACQGKYQCRGSENYCISPEYVCDSHYNCAVPLGGGDEFNCKDPESYPSIFSITTTIITSLASIVGAAFLIGCIITLAKKIRSQSSSQSRSVTPRPGLLSEVSAPPLQRQHTLPPYEAVVMADADPSWKSSTPETQDAGELPPNYESLFPDGPPKPVSHPTLAPSPVNQPTAATTENNQQEQNSYTPNAPIAES